jgi:hypothetical protein
MLDLVVEQSNNVILSDDYVFLRKTALARGPTRPT